MANVGQGARIRDNDGQILFIHTFFQDLIMKDNLKQNYQYQISKMRP